MKTKDELLDLCRRMDLPDAEALVRSELSENIPQVARHAFLKGAWAGVVPDGDLSWIENAERANPPGSNRPYAGVAEALRKLKKEGADVAAVAEIVRGMQAQLLFHISYLLADPDSVAGNDGTVGWALLEVSEEGEVGRAIDGLHESVLSTDPTGREMRPKNEASQ
jgi:hypothetical protein